MKTYRKKLKKLNSPRKIANLRKHRIKNKNNIQTQLLVITKNNDLSLSITEYRAKMKYPSNNKYKDIEINTYKDIKINN